MSLSSFEVEMCQPKVNIYQLVKRHSERNTNCLWFWYHSYQVLVTLVSSSGNTRFWFWYQLFWIPEMFIFDIDTMCIIFLKSTIKADTLRKVSALIYYLLIKIKNSMVPHPIVQEHSSS